LAGKQGLVLNQFPAYLGPAYFISPHDAEFAPRLFYGAAFPLATDFTGAIEAVPAPGGAFIHTLLSIYGADQFLYFPNQRILQIQCTGINQGRLQFEVQSSRAAAYELLTSVQNSRVTKHLPLALDVSAPLSVTRPSGASLRIDRARARQTSRDMLISLQVDATVTAPSRLAMMVSFRRGGGFHRWGVLRGELGFNPFPILLGPIPAKNGSAQPVRHHTDGDQVIASSAGGQANSAWTADVQLHEFPKTESVELEFFIVSSHHLPDSLGRIRAAVEQ
jgi:hypothetical protein